MQKKDPAVSEIIGTLLVFAMVITTFTALEAWYVPSTEGTYEQQFQTESQTALASLISQIESPSLSYGDVISQNIPLGIQGTLFSPSQSTSLSYQPSGFSSSLSYGLGVNYKLLENTVPSAITNEVVGTIPGMNGIGPTQSITFNGITYITDFASNSMEEINATSHVLIGNYGVGLHPAGIAYDKDNHLLYISNFYEYLNYQGKYYSTITVFNPATNSIVKTINSDGLNTDILYPSGLVYVPLPFENGIGYLYVSVLIPVSNSGTYLPGVAVINTTNYQVANLIKQTQLVPKGLEVSNVALGPPDSSTGTVVPEIWFTDYWQNNLTVLLVGSPSSSGFENPSNITVPDVMSPYGIAYDSVTSDILVTNSTNLLTMSGVPHQYTPITRGESQNGNITVISTLLSLSGLTPGAGISNLPTPNIPEPVAIAVTVSGGTSTAYVSGYTTLYNATGDFSYSSIEAFDSHYYLTGYNYSLNNAESYNYPNGTIRFLQGPDSLNIYGDQLIVSDNLTDNTLFLSQSGGKTSASNVWNNPFNKPIAISYINGTNYLAVVNAGSESVNILDTVTSDSVVASFYVGQQPTSVAYDPANKYLYVTNSLSDNVTVIDPSLSDFSHSKTVANITLPFGDDPSYVVYDPHNQSMYVVDNGTGNLTQIVNTSVVNEFSINSPNAALNHVLQYLKGNNGKHGFVYANQNGSEEFYVTNEQSINYLEVRVNGTGSVHIGIGTTNIGGSNPWVSSGEQTQSIINNHKKGEWVTIKFSNTFLAPGTKYYVNVEWASGHVTWGYTETPNFMSKSGYYLEDYFYYNGVLTGDNNTPYGYEIGFSNQPTTGPTAPFPSPTAAVISPINNILYVANYGGSNVTVVNLSNTQYPVVLWVPTGLMPRSLAYDPLDNTIFVGNSGSGSVTVINALNLAERTFGVGSGAFPLGLVMDVGNGYVYVGNNGSNNITLENTFTSQTINSIATGITPSALAYDALNGLIYVLDTDSNQMTIINGGSLYFNGQNGIVETPVFTGKGQLVSYGDTSFVTPVAFYLQDGMILSNYSSSQYVKSSANVPVSVVQSSGKIYFSSFILNLGGSPSSISGLDTTSLELSVSQYSANHVYQGQQFTHYDLYGNPYPAMVTNLTLTYFDYTITTNYASEINQILYNEFNGSLSGSLNSWDFSGFPIHVSLNSQGNYLTVDSTQPISLYSVNLIYEDLTVVNV